MTNTIKTFLGLIIMCVLVTELAALLEHTSFINFNFIVPTIISQIF